MKTLTSVTMAASVALMAATAPASAQDGRAAFSGKEVALLIGAGPGGGADTYGRLFARHAGRHLAGNPSIVPRNVQGAGGLRVANHIYNVAPKDGTEIGMFPTSAALQPLFSNPGAKFDTVGFTWVGNMDSDPTVCGAWRHTGIRTWGDLKGRETRFGAASPQSATSVHAKVVGDLLGVKTTVIHGYQGTQTANLAMQRGELDGTCGLFVSTIRAQYAREVESGDMTIWMTFGKTRAADFPNVPTVYEVVRNADDRMLAELVFGQDAVSRPLAAPPGLTPGVVQVLRDAFDAAMKDAALREEAAKLGLGIQPMSGAETQKQYESFFGFPKPVVERLMEITARR